MQALLIVLCRASSEPESAAQPPSLALPGLGKHKDYLMCMASRIFHALQRHQGMQGHCSEGCQC